MEQRPKYRSKNYKTLRRKYKQNHCLGLDNGFLHQEHKQQKKNKLGFTKL